MALHGTYDPDNIFAKMLRGEMPCIKVYEDDVALAFMDIFPQLGLFCFYCPVLWLE